MSGSCESEGEEQCSYNRCVSVCGCMQVYGGSSVRNCVVMSHVFVWSEQDGCERDGFVQVDKGLDGQIVENKVSQATVCQFLYMVVVNDLPMSEKGVTMGRMFLYVLSVEITGCYTLKSFLCS